MYKLLRNELGYDSITTGEGWNMKVFTVFYDMPLDEIEEGVRKWAWKINVHAINSLKKAEVLFESDDLNELIAEYKLLRLLENGNV